MVKNIRKKLLKTIFPIAIIVMIIIPKQEIAASNIMLGDINDDKIVDSRDMLYILRHIATKVNKKHPEWELKEEKLEVADVTKDEKVDAEDMLLVLRYIAASNSETIKNKHPEWIEFKKKETVKDTKEQETKEEEKTKPEQEQEKIKQETKQEQEETKQETKKEQETKQEETKKQEEQTTKPEPKTIEVTNVKLDKTKLELDMSKTKTEKIKATIEPSNATDKKITYKSKNEKVAEVDSSGIITAKSNGTATITAKAVNGKIATCLVTVKTSATSVSLMISNGTLNIGTTGNTARLVATVQPNETTEGEVEWTNSNPASVAIEKVIEEGTYRIQSALDNNKVIDITGASKASGAKVQLYNRNQSTAQQFEIISVEDGYYKIRAKCSNKMIDVKNRGQTAGTIVQQWTSNTSDAQLWEFEYAGNGYYYIKSKCNGLYLDVKGGKTDNGTQIQMYTENRSNAQKFKLQLIEKKAKIVEEGTYRIQSALDNNKVIDITGASTVSGAKVQLYSGNQSMAQRFELISIGNGYYKIRAKCSNQMLDVKGRGQTAGTIVQQWTSNASDAQIWKIESAGNGYYYIKSKCNGLFLDVKEGKTNNGTQIQVYTGNKSNAQKFKFEKISDTVNKNINIVTIKAKGTKAATGTITAKIANGATATCKIKVEQPFPNESARIAYNRIKNIKSSTKYIVAVDYDRNYMNVFKGSAGSWKSERTFRVVAGRHRYFGDEKYRKGNTNIGIFHLNGYINYNNGHATPSVPLNPKASDSNHIHGYLYNPSPTNKKECEYVGKDWVEKNLSQGNVHITEGCICLKRNDILWFVENVAKKGTTVVVFTEKPATSKDTFQNSKLKSVMIKKGYSDVNQLTAAEKKYVYK